MTNSDPNHHKHQPAVASRSTLLADIAPALASLTTWRRYPILTLEAAVTAGVGLLLTARWGGTEAAVISIFLAAAALTPRLMALLEENRELVYAVPSGQSTRPANMKTVLSVCAIFCGLLLAFTVTAALLGPEGTLARFAVVGELSAVGHDDLLSRDFQSFGHIIGHNLRVLLSIATLSFVYRAFGLTTVLVWNAASWGLLLTTMAKLTLQQSSVPLGVFLPIATLAVLPHMLIEGLAYVVGGLAAVYLSQAIAKYGPSDARLPPVLRIVAKLAAVALIAVLVGAAVEAMLPKVVLSRLQ
ncbi:MAG: stage II sporulation protein M [Myxococcales bacterium]|nr:stage II sporulation protein M [Myxococcales bacterium]